MVSTASATELAALESLDGQAAFDYLDQLIGAYPQDVRLFLMLAALHAEAGATDAAEATYLQLLAAAPNLEIARFQLGLLQMVNGRALVARTTLQPLASKAGEDALKHFSTALIALGLGDSEAALQGLQQGILLSDNAPLRRDMQALLERLRGQVGSDEEDGVNTGDHQHVLMAAYRKLH